MKKLMLPTIVLILLLASSSSNGVAQNVQPQAADTVLKPMEPDSNPGFEVATIRPSDPEHPMKGALGHRIAFSGTLRFMLGFVYDLHDKQIADAPDWMSTESFDFDGVSDTPGAPNLRQVKIMFQKLFADRFQLKFHREKRELSAYVLTLAKNGPKLNKSMDAPNGMPSLMLQPGFPKVGIMKASNVTMADFAHLMQSGILDRPVVDQTGLQGKFDFLLKWTPDESQFTQVGTRIPSPSDAADAPNLFTAIQEQIGLKLATAKTPVDVLVIDHVEKPSAN